MSMAAEPVGKLSLRDRKPDSTLLPKTKQRQTMRYMQNNIGVHNAAYTQYIYSAHFLFNNSVINIIKNKIKTLIIKLNSPNENCPH